MRKAPVPISLLVLWILVPILSTQQQAVAKDQPIEVGVAWEGKSVMPERVLEGLQEVLLQQAPRIRLEIRKELKSLLELNAAINDFETNKKAMVILRSSGAKLLGSRGATIPAFIGATTDPIAMGVTDGIGNPNPNITGVTYHLPAIQKLECFQSIYPGLKRILLLVEADHPGSFVDIRDTETAAEALGIQVRVAQGRSVSELIAAVDQASTEEAIVFGIQALVMDNITAIVDSIGDRMAFALSGQSVEKGALAGIVADDKKLGRMLGQSLVDHLIHGRPLKDMPILTDPEPRMLFNLSALEKHRQRVSITIYQLAKSSLALESILRSAPSGIGLVENRVITQVNNYILNLTGYTREELIGKNARMLYPTQGEFDYVGEEKYRQIAQKGTGSVETRWVCKDGSIRHIILSSSPLDPFTLSKGVTFTVQDITYRKRAEELLKESEDRFGRLFKDHAAAMLLIDSESGDIVDANLAAIAFYGWSHEQLIGKPISAINILSPTQIHSEMNRAKDKKRTYFEFKHRRADGVIRDVAVQSSGITLQGRSMLHSIIRDITEEKAMESRVRWTWIAIALLAAGFMVTLLFLLFRLRASLECQRTAMLELKKSEDTRNRIFESSKTPIVIMDPETQRFIDCNPAAVACYGHRCKKETLGKTPKEVSAPFQYDGTASEEKASSFILEALEKDAVVFDWLHQRPDGKRWDAEVHLMSFQFDGKTLMQFSLADVTERKRATNAIQESEERFFAFINASRDMIFIKDADSRYLVANCATATFFGVSNQEMIGKTDHELAEAGKVLPCLLSDKRALEAATPFTVEELMGDKHCETTKFPILLKNNKKGIGGIIRDITERKKKTEELKRINLALQLEIEDHKQTEKELRIAMQAAKEANLAKSLFLSNMSHELRTPLNPIIGFTELLMDAPNLTEEQRSWIELIHHRGNDLLGLIGTVLDLCKIEAKKIELIPVEISLHATLSELVRSFAPIANKKGLQLTSSVHPNTPDSCWVDALRLRQILLNLINNAIKFTPSGSVDVYAEAMEDASREGACGLDECYILFTIRDTGIGIPEHRQEAIFESFTQSDPEHAVDFGGGTGLGLTIVKSLVELMRGRIWVESAPGRGSTFRFTICVGKPPPDRLCPVRGS